MPEIARDKVTWVKAPKLNLAEQIYLPTIAQGMVTTLKHMVGTLTGTNPIRTQQYPEQKPSLPPHYRGVHRLNRDEQGRVKCVSCYMCSTACPAHCIDIVAAPSPWPDREKYPELFVIDELRCIYCGMCEQACPVDAIVEGPNFEFSTETHEELLYDKEKLLSNGDKWEVAVARNLAANHLYR